MNNRNRFTDDLIWELLDRFKNNCGYYFKKLDYKMEDFSKWIEFLFVYNIDGVISY